MLELAGDILSLSLLRLNTRLEGSNSVCLASRWSRYSATKLGILSRPAAAPSDEDRTARGGLGKGEGSHRLFRLALK